MKDNNRMQILNKTRVYQGVFLSVDKVDLQLPSGRHTTHDVLRHPGAVGILALDNAAHVLMVRQYRTAFECEMLEIPAGKLEIGEDPMSCAKRELEEETGYAAGSMQLLSSFAVAAGYCDEMLHLFLAKDLREGVARPDLDEFVFAEWVPLETLLLDVREGRLIDAKSIIAVLLAQTITKRLQAVWP